MRKGAERKIFEKVISGGQTGADQGALDAALELFFLVLIGLLALHTKALWLFPILQDAGQKVSQPNIDPNIYFRYPNTLDK